MKWHFFHQLQVEVFRRNFLIRVQLEDFDPGIEIDNLSADNYHIGGISSFVGLVRDMYNDHKLISMTLEHYPKMTEKMLEEIQSEAFKRWSLEGCLIIHRYGQLNPGEKIVMVATASLHRQDSLESCAFLIDWLKTKAPFWKLEHSTECDNGKWVEAKEDDNIATRKWDKIIPNKARDI
ncbi:MAG: molybdenum cofactor biosynthesis protein MoaE [Rhodospirillaceae bacterium]|nr:molybdenum cofactor biosynthesis protein MoaE [Rhodospirillaceae bacterium]